MFGEMPVRRFPEPSGRYCARWFIQSVTRASKLRCAGWRRNCKAYHVVDEAELAKASGTEHHGGVCFLIKNVTAPLWLSGWRKPTLKIAWLALEDVGNPHNLGAIMRSCAHFRR